MEYGREEENENKNLNLREIFDKYFAFWPLFVACIFVCVIMAYLYLRFQTPVYNINASVLIVENDTKKSGNSAIPISAVSDLGMFSLSNNFDNEIQILQSRNLNRTVVCRLNLYTNIYLKRLFSYNVPLYHDSPVNVYMDSDDAEKMIAPLKLNLALSEDGTVDIQGMYVLGAEKKIIEKKAVVLPAVVRTEYGKIFLSKNDSVEIQNETCELVVVIANPSLTAEAYVRNLSVEPASKTTTIAKLSLKNTVPERGVEYINKLVEAYNEDANTIKNEVANKTADFINVRLGIIEKELSDKEADLANFKQRYNLTDISNDAALFLQENSKYEQELIENEIQVKLVSSFQEYLNIPENIDKMIPVNIGISDNNLASLINEYNSMLVERERICKTSTENNPALVNIDVQIDAARKSIVSSVNRLLKGLQMSQSEIARQTGKYEERISETPMQEKEYLRIVREREVVSSLYTMLLEKREVNVIKLASTANNGRLIENAMFGPQPVSPNKKIFLLVALFMGLGIPVAVIYLKDLLQYKIKTAEDVGKLSDVTLLAEVPVFDNHELGSICVRENANGIAEECFREIRTNLFFMLEKDEKVIMFTSTQPGEGKTFLASNMAVSLSYTGKKVLIVGFDIRKPQLFRAFDFKKDSLGVTNYLIDPEHNPLDSLIYHDERFANLDILPSGTIPPNPTELLMRDSLNVLMTELKVRYDYIIMDTAPIGIVTDTSILGKYADVCVYVCRSGVTPKADFTYINTLKTNQNIEKLCVLLNSVSLKKSGYYGKRYTNNRYGRYYGNGRRYGYGNQ